MSQRFFIYGVPGSGKTYFSERLSKKFGLPLVELDSIKQAEDLGTCQAYIRFGPLSNENAILGMKAVRDKYRGKVDEITQNNKTGIFDAAFVDPHSVQSEGSAVLVFVPDEKLHREHFFAHRKSAPETESEFQAARLVQEYLVQEAKGLGIQILQSWEVF